MPLKNLMYIYSTYLIYDELMTTMLNKEITIVNTMEISNSINQELEYLLKKYNVYDDNTCVLSISSNKDNMSSIVWSS